MTMSAGLWRDRGMYSNVSPVSDSSIPLLKQKHQESRTRETLLYTHPSLHKSDGIIVRPPGKSIEVSHIGASRLR